MALRKRPLLEIRQKTRGESGNTVSDYVEGFSNLRTYESLDGDGWASFALPLESPSYANVLLRRVLVVIFEPISAPDTNLVQYAEYRIAERVGLNLQSERKIQVTARSLLYDLADCGPIKTLGVDGFNSRKIIASYTITQAITNLILPTLTAAGYNYLALGTIDFTDVFEINLDDQTPLQLLQWFRQQNSGEFILRRKTDLTGYLLDFRTAINLSAGAGYLDFGRNLLGDKQTLTTNEQATILIPKSTNAKATFEAGSDCQYTAWKITAIDTGNLDITVGDVNGLSTTKLISEDDQFNGYRVQFVLANFRYNVTDTFVATPKLRLTSVNGLVVEDWFELRKNDVGLVTRTNFSIAHDRGEQMVRASTVASNVLTLSTGAHSSLVGVVGDPLAYDGQYIGLTVRAWQRTLQTTLTNITGTGSTRQLTLTTTTGLAVGDYGFFTAFGSTAFPHSWAISGGVPGGIVKVVSVDSGTLVTVDLPFPNELPHHGLHVAGAPQYTTTWYRRRAGSTDVTADSASANTITVRSAAAISVATDDILEFFYSSGGTREGEIRIPSAVTAFGEKRLIYQRSDIGGWRNLAGRRNPWFRTWTSGVPDEWLKPLGTISQVATPLTGDDVLSPFVVQFDSAGAYLITKKFLSLIATDQANVTLWIRARANIDSAKLSVRIYHGMYDGLTSAPIPSPALGEVTFGGPMSAATIKSSVAGEWVDFGLTITMTPGVAGLELRRGLEGYSSGIRIVLLNDTTNIQVAGVMLIAGAVTPNVFTELDPSALLWSQGRTYIESVKSGYLTFDLSVADLQRLLPDDVGIWERLALGQIINVHDPLLAAPDGTPLYPGLRVVALEQDFERWNNTRLTVNSLAQRLTKLIDA